MFGRLQLLSTFLDLDLPWVSLQEFEPADPAVIYKWRNASGFRRIGFDWRWMLCWLMPLLKNGLDSKATAFHILRVRSEDSLRQQIYVPVSGNAGSYEWRELLPMSYPFSVFGISAVRMIANMILGRRNGIIHYRYQQRKSKAVCVQVTKNDLVIYVANDRPTFRFFLPQE